MTSIKIGDKIQWKSSPGPKGLYEVIKGNKVYSEFYEETYGGYPIKHLEERLNEGAIYIVNQTYEIY